MLYIREPFKLPFSAPVRIRVGRSTLTFEARRTWATNAVSALADPLSFCMGRGAAADAVEQTSVSRVPLPSTAVNANANAAAANANVNANANANGGTASALASASASASGVSGSGVAMPHHGAAAVSASSDSNMVSVSNSNARRQMSNLFASAMGSPAPTPTPDAIYGAIVEACRRQSKAHHGQGQQQQQPGAPALLGDVTTPVVSRQTSGRRRSGHHGGAGAGAGAGAASGDGNANGNGNATPGLDHHGGAHGHGQPMSPRRQQMMHRAHSSSDRGSPQLGIVMATAPPATSSSSTDRGAAAALASSASPSAALGQAVGQHDGGGSMSPSLLISRDPLTFVRHHDDAHAVSVS